MMMRNYILLSWVLFFSSGLFADAAYQVLQEDAKSSFCYYVKNLTCNTPKWVVAPTQNNLQSINYDLAGCFSPTQSYSGKDTLFRFNAGSTPRDITVKVSSASTDLDLFAFRSCSSSYSGTVLGNCAGYSAQVGLTEESITISDATGVYYFVVDIAGIWDSSSFEISVTCHSSPPPYYANCTSGTDLACGEVIYVPKTGNNSFNQDNYDLSSCDHASFTYEGADHVYHINVGSSPKDISIKMDGLSADMDMFLFKSCSDYGATIFSNCQGQSINSGHANERIDLDNATGTYILVIDGYSTYVNSSFQLSLTCTSYTPPSPSCYGATPLYCGDSKWAYAPTHNNFDHYSYDLSGCLGYGYSYEGKDHLYKIDVGLGYGYGNDQELVITLTGNSADLDLLLFRSCGSSYGLTQCVDYSINSGYGSEEITVSNASGTYYLSVDSADPWYTSGYEISVACNTTHHDNCYNATPLYCGDSKWVNAPTYNNLEGNDYSLSGCLGYNYSYTGKDHLYQIDAGYTSNKQLVIKLWGQSADFDLLLFASCGTGYGYGTTQLSQCIAYSINPGSGSEEIIVDNASGTYYLAVDNADPWYNSGYEISVTCHTVVEDICHYATPLYCGDSKWVYAATQNHFDNTHYDYAGCFGYNYGFTGYDHLYEIDAGYTPRDITIRVTNLSADLDMLLFKSCGSSSYGYGYGGYWGLSQCVDYSLKGGYSDEEITIYGATGTYYLSVDANEPWDRSGYEISVTCHNQHYNFTCDDAIWLDCNDSKWSDAPTANNLSDTDYILSGCGGYYSDNYEGYDHLYEISLGYEEQRLEIELLNLTEDMDLLVFSSCSPNYSSARLGGCKGISASSGYASESVVIEHASGTYFIAVDAKSAWDNSSYKIKTTCTSYGYTGGGDDDPIVDDPIDDDPIDTDDPTPTNPDTLRCGYTYYGTTVDGDSDFENEDIIPCFQTNLLYTGADQLVLFEKANDDDVLELILIQDDANLSLFILDDQLNILDINCKGLNYSTHKMIENSDVVGEVYTDDGALTAGTYYALIEGYNRLIESDFVLSMACGVGCEVSDSLTCQSSLVGLTNIGSPNNHNVYVGPDSISLVGYTGGEWTASLFVDSLSEITINLTKPDSTGDLDLFVLDSCGTNHFIAASTHQDSSHEQIIISLDAGAYIVVVDGWNGGSGSFDIEVTGCEDVTLAATGTAQTRSASRKAQGGDTYDVSAVPNPFNDLASLYIEAPKTGKGSLQLFSIDGRLIHDRQVELQKGHNRIRLDESSLGDNFGMIIYRLNTGEESLQGTLLRVR